MEQIIWENTFKKYMDFIYINKRFPKKNLQDPIENECFNWAKKQRCLYTRKKLDEQKIKTLNNYRFWYFKSIDKNKKIQELNLFFIEKNEISIVDRNDIVIDIEKFDIFEDDTQNQNNNFLKKIINYFSNFIKTNDIQDIV